MPVLSLPLPRLSTGILEYLPIRVPFPFMRIASILPQAINEPIRISLMALFKLAWSAKVQLPVLITVCFMAFDIRLQLKISIFWENNVRQHAAYGYNGANHRDATGQRRASREDMRRTALMAAALYQQQRRRLIQEIRAQQVRQRETVRRSSLPLQVKINAPLATAEDSDLEETFDHNGSDTVTCSHASIATEDGSIGTDEEAEGGGASSETKAKLKKDKSRQRTSSKVDNEEEDDEDYEDENEDDFDDDDDDTSSDDDDDDDDESDDLGGSSRGGFSSHGGGGNGLDDQYDHDDDLGDNSYGDGGGYSSPLVVEVEIRHRADSCQIVEDNGRTPKVPLFTTIYNTNNINIFKRVFNCQSLVYRENTFTVPSTNMYVL